MFKSAGRAGLSAAGLVIALGVSCGGAPPGPDDGGLPYDAGATTLDAGGGVVHQGWPDCPFVAPAAPPCAGVTLLEKLACVPGLTVTAWSPPGDAPSSIDFTVRQPVDHRNPDAGSFEQLGHLDHVSFDAPLVLSTTGYALFDQRPSEPARLFGANELHLEYRFFGVSAPSPIPWSKLDVEQASADFHAVREAFKWIYPARWLSTGISKGGMTVVHYRRSFPCDVDGTIAYSAPESYGAADPGYGPFLDAVGGATWADCRQRLHEAQRAMLTHRAELVARMPDVFTLAGSKDRVLEHGVLELGFAFWQYTPPDDVGHGCPAIPAASATAAQLYAFLDWHVGLAAYFGDSGFVGFEPYYYQAATELGGPAPYEAPVVDLLSYPGTYVAATYAPPGVALPFDAQAMPAVQQWLSTSGSRVLFLYGELDPWRGRPFELGAASDSARYVVAGGNHLSAIADLPAADEAAAKALVRRWVELP